MNPPQRWTGRDIPDQRGRIAIVTGANGGIGLQQARALAAQAAHVVLGCRSADKGEAARASIRAEFPQAQVSVEPIDTADLASVRACARRIVEKFSRVDLLINNAGIMATPRALTVDGFEQQLATNPLGHFALTGLLLPALQAAPGSRVVSVSSLAARRGRLHLDDLSLGAHYDPWLAYNQSKLANLVFTQELQRRLARAGSRTIAVAAHPGIAATNLFSTPGGAFKKKIVTGLVSWLFQPAERGALPILYAATAPGVRGGDYYGPGGPFEVRGWPAPARLPQAARDPHTAGLFWEQSERLTGVAYL